MLTKDGIRSDKNTLDSPTNSSREVDNVLNEFEKASKDKFCGMQEEQKRKWNKPNFIKQMQQEVDIKIQEVNRRMDSKIQDITPFIYNGELELAANHIWDMLLKIDSECSELDRMDIKNKQIELKRDIEELEAKYERCQTNQDQEPLEMILEKEKPATWDMCTLTQKTTAAQIVMDEEDEVK